MKILIVVNHFPVLSEAFVARKVQELIHRNHEVIICASTYNDDLYRNFFGGDKKIKIILFSKINALGWLLLHPLSLINKTKTNAWHSYIASVINKIKPGIVHLEFSGLGAFYLPAVKKIHFPVMVSCHGTAEKVHLNLYEHRKNSLKELFDIADSIHCVSRDLKETIAPYCSYAQKIFINYSAVPVDYFKRENPYKNKEQLTILSVGRLNYIKGYLTGLLAIKELKKDAQNFKWIIVGEGKQRKELSFYIYALGLQNDVFLAGAKMGDEVKQAYRDADIFLLPANYA